MKGWILVLALSGFSAGGVLGQKTDPRLSKYKALQPRVKYGAGICSLRIEKSISERNRLTVQYYTPGLPSVKISIRSESRKDSHRTIVSHAIEIRSAKKMTDDLSFYFPVNTIAGSSRLWYPLKNGLGKTIESPARGDGAMFRSAGRSEEMANDLSIPVAVYDRDDGKVAVITDPYFSSTFGDEGIHWTYPKEVGLEDSVESRVVVEVYGLQNAEDAIDAFYGSVLEDVPPGPAWLKDIAMISYDYMSDEGRGWYNDIDSLVQNVSLPDRGKILLNIHGWYDFVGRYGYNARTNMLDSQWRNAVTGKWITLDELHQRIRYAKERGFRVAFYFADGIISGDQLGDYSSEKAIPGGGWAGPDMLGKTYRRNIACQEYYQFYTNYASALFDVFGREVDAFVWDETFYIPAGHLGTSHCRSYLDRTFMRLVKEIAANLHRINPEAAFMTSDAIGPRNTGYADFADVPPYALLADGTYQDSYCSPEYWSYGIFPNYRNVLWSCNWWAVSRFAYTMFGVLQYQAPVVFTNGWEDNVGFSELSGQQKRRFRELFNFRKSHSTKLKWFDILPPYIEVCD